MGVLSGYKIIELSGIGPGPLCGMLFADLGAEVIRVDRKNTVMPNHCLLYTSPSPRDLTASRMPSSA